MSLEVDEQCDKDLVMMQEAMIRVKDAQPFAEIAQEQVHDRRSEENRGILNRARELVRETTAATHSLSCSTNDRHCNEVKYLQEALDLTESFLRRDTHHDDFELITLERSLSS